MYGPVLDDENMLTVDLRGTGSSTPLNCPGLQDWTGQASGPAFDAVVASCAAALNHRWKEPDGSYVHASDLFTSAPAARDVATVIEDLGLGKVDLYGDSYGSFFAQTLASRYPRLIHSVVLDSTYETQDLDPWYRSSLDNMPANYDNACSRSPACAAAAPGPAWDDIEALAVRLRAHPVSGRVPGPDGVVEPVTMDSVGLVDLTNDGAGDPDIYRDLDAAARALLTSGDPDPLLRLYAERTAYQEDYFDTPARVYSGELYQAVSCLDYPQLYDMDATPAERQAELAQAAAALPAATFFPFTTEEWLAQDQNTEAYTSCTAWPSPVEAVPPTVGQPLLPRSIPVLILGGEFDTWTPPSDVPKVIAELGGHVRFIELANSTHVVGEDDTTCGDDLVQAFVSDPGGLDSMDASCAPAVPPIHSVGTYAPSLAGVTPLTADAGSTGSPRLLQLGAAAVATAGDAVARSADILGSTDHGLHGGLAVASHGTITLTGDVLVPGVSVSGTVHMGATTVTAALVTVTRGHPRATFDAQWAVGGASGALAHVTGTSGRQSIAGSTYAP
jgi:pimeloyl-ACP methyl ester carboxylesterase